MTRRTRGVVRRSLAELDGSKENPTGLSVIASPPDVNAPRTEPLIFFAAAVGDEITPWGRSPKLRDRQLREFIPTETTFATSLGTVVGRNMAFSWAIDGAGRTAARMQEILEESDLGRGWTSLLSKTSIDLYSQDSGAYWELVRETDSPTSPVVAVNHLDALFCYLTGNHEYPVIYQDRLGKYHRLAWHQVVHFAELPAPWERGYGLQFCALTRLMRAAQIIKSIGIYQYEKTSGRFNRAVHLIQGVTVKEIADAKRFQESAADAAGLLRYIQPLLVASKDPKANVKHDTIELASLPDGWDSDKEYKLYIAEIARAFLTDYQEFAPLPGGNLGSSMQSQILHLKTQGKGPALFMKIISRGLNWRVFPQNVKFLWTEEDPESARIKEEVKLLRAQRYKALAESGILDSRAIQQLMYDDGDIPEEIFRLFANPDVTSDVRAGDEVRLPGQKEEGGGGFPTPFWRQIWGEYP